MKKNLNLLEFLLVLYFSLGMLKGIRIFEYVDYILSIGIQVLCIYYISKKDNKFPKKYILMLFFILLLVFEFIIIDVGIGGIIKRVFPLISIFGIILVNNIEEINIELLIKRILDFYFILGSFIILDAIFYYVFSFSIWPPERYLGYRFSGPFYDSNFMSITYCAMLILKFFIDYHKENKIDLLKIIVFVICILLGKSWSAIIVIIVSFVISKIMKSDNLFKKQLIFIMIYFFLLYFINKYNIQIQEIFCNFLDKITSYNEQEILAKYNSFYYRIESQTEAIRLFLNKPFGYGPLQIVNYIGMDVHNSYIAFLFELGLIGFLLQILSLPSKIFNIKELNMFSIFIILMSFTINIHYTVLFSLLLMLTHSKKIKNYEV